MAKIAAPAPKAPTTPEPATPDAPAPDLSLLIANLEPLFLKAAEIEGESRSNNVNIALAVREFREENPGLERGDAKLAIQQAIASAWGLKLAEVQNHKTAKDENGKLLKGYSAYTMVSSLLSIAWPKGEAEEKKVTAAIKKGAGWTELKKAASKPQKSNGSNPDARRITVDNFPAKLNNFLQQAQVDTALALEDIFDMAESAITAMRNAPPV